MTGCSRLEIRWRSVWIPDAVSIRPRKCWLGVSWDNARQGDSPDRGSCCSGQSLTAFRHTAGKVDNAVEETEVQPPKSEGAGLSGCNSVKHGRSVKDLRSSPDWSSPRVLTKSKKQREQGPDRYMKAEKRVQLNRYQTRL